MQAKTGTGYSDNPEYLTDVIEEKSRAQIADAGIEDSTAVLTVLVSNIGLAEEYRIRQIGIFAVDDETGEEILFIIGQDETGDKVPAESYGRVEYQYIVHVKVINAANITLDINDSDFVLKKTFHSAVINLQNQIDELVSAEVENAFYAIFNKLEGSITDTTALTAADINEAINTLWDGESSADITAMSKDDINNAIHTPWDGKSSTDETALSSADIKKATTL